MIRGTDGLDYENITEKLLGNPAGTPRNQYLQVEGPKDAAYRAVLALPADADPYTIWEAGRKASRGGATDTITYRYNRSALDGISAKLSGKRPLTAIFDEYASLPAPAHPAGPGAEGTC